MKEEFLKDQKRWPKDWNENFFYYMAIIIGILTVTLVCWLSSDVVKLLKSGLTNWNDARGLGFLLGGVVAPFVTFMGLHLSSGSLREQEKQNVTNEAQNSIAHLERALHLIDQDADTKRIVGLALLRESDFGRNRVIVESALSALREYSERHKVNFEYGEQEIEWARWEASEAFKSFLALCESRENLTGKPTIWPRLDNVNFRRILITDAASSVGAMFRNCSFQSAQFIATSLKYSRFEHCSFVSTRLTRCSFYQVQFNMCEISNLYFKAETKKDCSSLFSNCTYLADKPPHVPVGTLLPVPDVMDLKIHVPRRKMTSNEAHRWGDPRFIPKFDESGKLLGMEYTGSNPPISQPKPDPGPDPLIPS